MWAYSYARSGRWIYGLVLALMVLSIVFGGTPQAARAQSQTPPPQIAPSDQGGGDDLSAQCTPKGEPRLPTLVAPADGSTLITTVPQLSWKSASGYCIKYYNIQVWVDGGSMVLSAWPTATNFTIPAGKLTWGVKYNWYVWAYNIIYEFGDPLIASFSTTTVKNDDFNSLTSISATPYTLTGFSTVAATTSSDDPALPSACGTGQGSNSVWWSFTPNSKGALDINTAGSDYDTLLAVWTGTRGALVNFACNDNSPTDTTSVLTGLNVKAGTTYYIEVVQPGSLGTGGSLDLSLVFNTAAVSATYVSVGAYDGWALETSDGSNKGGSLDSTSSLLIVGNTANGRRYHSFLSFDAGSSHLPANAVIISAVVSLTVSNISSTNPFDLYTGLKVDMRKPYYGSSIQLTTSDFQASSQMNSAGAILAPSIPTSVYSASLLPAAFKYINKTGTTQFQLRFPGDDIDNDLYDTVKFYSGDAPTASFRPVLVVTYYMP
jgi:hypothetical protein